MLSPLSLRLHRGHLDPHLHLGHRRHLLCLGPPDPPRRPCSSALRLRLRLLLHLLRRRWPAPWSRRPSLLHGSSLRRLHCGPSSWLWPGSCGAPPAPGPSCLFPGSSLLRRLHGLCLPAPTRAPVLLLSLLPSFRLPFPFGRYEYTPSGRGAICQDCGLFCVFCSPCVSCNPVFPSCWLLIWFHVSRRLPQLSCV